MNPISNINTVEVSRVNDFENSNMDLKYLFSKSLEKHYLNLGKIDLNNLRFNFLKNFEFIFNSSENKESIYKIYIKIDAYFDFLKNNLAVYTKSEYEQLSNIIKVATIIMETGVRLNDFHHFYEGYVSLRNNINKFKLSKTIYKEIRVF